ncbi:hypothetical protein NE848_12800 [Gramella jeungdoensis]|uniref:Uncharacterized protein n=1 Tax=Gramella jeungdoensis TaxID=708091 RepID=A0ABT0Z4C6_9FLAO|nr:hypothetical protein [Gramella jeungdoensis]MCM8570265.1 hypothetical protein [Gramella jeungdoensis]
MKQLFTLSLFLVIGYVNAQSVTHKSLMTEYIMEPQPNIAPSEWIDRDIKIDSETITIISYGENETDIQTWNIDTRMNINNADGNNKEAINTYLASDNQTPATFVIHYQKDGKVEIIDCKMVLPNGTPTTIRFHID